MKSIFTHITAGFLIVFLTTNTSAQYNWDIGIKAGAANYLGEIGGKEKTRRNFILDLKLKSTSLVAGGFVRYKFNDQWSINNSLSIAQIKGDDALSTNPARVWRNLRFKNTIIELSSRAEFNFFIEPDLGGRGRYNKEFKSFIHGGLTCFYHNPKGSTDGTTWHALRPLQTEGFSYKKLGIGIPVGLGFVFTYDRNHRIGFDFSWTPTFTDYLDDISTVYNDPNNMTDLGASLANQSEGVVPESERLNFVAGEKRGDPTHDDTYMFMTVSYSYFIQSRNKYYKNSRSRIKNNRGRKSRIRRVRAKF
ncbi:MAG: hypothetical protein CL853_02305 [Crocinitomicaceae bacterium]|nr:hypothetical protein [Crocinitomicaceae bacterium]